MAELEEVHFYDRFSPSSFKQVYMCAVNCLRKYCEPFISCSSDGQPVPPFNGFCVRTRVRSLVPSLSTGPHTFHCPTLQSTRTIVNLKKNKQTSRYNVLVVFYYISLISYHIRKYKYRDNIEYSLFRFEGKVYVDKVYVSIPV